MPSASVSPARRMGIGIAGRQDMCQCGDLFRRGPCGASPTAALAAWTTLPGTCGSAQGPTSLCARSSRQIEPPSSQVMHLPSDACNVICRSHIPSLLPPPLTRCCLLAWAAGALAQHLRILPAAASLRIRSMCRHIEQMMLGCFEAAAHKQSRWLTPMAPSPPLSVHPLPPCSPFPLFCAWCNAGIECPYQALERASSCQLGMHEVKAGRSSTRAPG